MNTATPDPWMIRLVIPAYSVTAAARYVNTTPKTIASWFYGRGDRPPVLSGKQRRVPLSYMQLVEMAFVATFRKCGLSMVTIRLAREYLSRELKTEFPFAHSRLQTEGKHILKEFGEGRDLLLIADRNGQAAWKSLIGKRFDQFDYDGNFAVRWFPNGGDHTVVIDPRLSFGKPSVRGVATWVLKDRWISGDGLQDIAADFGLESREVTEALQFEGIQLII